MALLRLLSTLWNSGSIQQQNEIKRYKSSTWPQQAERCTCCGCPLNPKKRATRKKPVLFLIYAFNAKGCVNVLLLSVVGLGELPGEIHFYFSIQVSFHRTPLPHARGKVKVFSMLKVCRCVIVSIFNYSVARHLNMVDFTETRLGQASLEL